MESADSRRLATKHSRKALKASLTLGILLGMFFVTWLPFFVANIVQVMPPLGVGESPPCWGGPESPRDGEGGREGCSAPRLQGVPPHLLQAVCDCISPGLFDVLTWLGYCNSTMNPIVYPLFMRDFKRALGRLLPCPRGPREHQPGLASPSVRTSHSGPRPGLSLRHVPPLPLPPDSDSDSDPGSGGFSGPRLTAQLLPPGEATRDAPPPARATTAVNFFSVDRTEPELRPHPPGTPTN